MSIKASAQITLSYMIDIVATYRYYLLQASTLAKPSVPTTYPPKNWNDAEPTYVDGATNSLYFVDLTEFSDGSFVYSPVSLSSAYEAAKLAYNKAQAAQDKADSIKITGRNLISYKSIAARGSTYSLTASANSTGGSITSDLYDYFFVVNNTLGMFNPGEVYTVSNKEVRCAYGRNSNELSTYIGVRLWDVVKSTSVYGAVTMNSGASVTFTVPENTIPENTVLYIYPASSTAVPFDIVDLKMEIGASATEWSVAPEDIDGAITDAQNSAGEAKGEIHNIETELVALKTAIGAIVRSPDGGTLVKQEADGLYFVFDLSELEGMISASRDKISNLEGVVTDELGNIDALKSSVYTLEQLLPYIKSYMNSTGQPCLELGEGDSAFKVLITNTMIQFKDGTTTPAYIGNKKLNIETAQVKGELQVGDDDDGDQEGVYVWRVRQNGNMGLTWRPKELVINDVEVNG